MHEALKNILSGNDLQIDRADMMIEQARWAAAAYVRMDRPQTDRIARAVAEAGFAKAAYYGEWAVRETGFGVAEHKRIKNELTSRALYEHYRDADLVSKRVDRKRKIVEVSRPAGVVFALAPSTNPVCTIYFKTLLAVMTRNAVILSPHPAARECCADAARTLAAAAEAAGAPAGAIQVVEQPTIPLLNHFMCSPRIDLIVATGGTAVVRAAYSSGNPAIGVGPGNAPVLVDRSADLRQAAERIVESKSFDNSLLCTNESVLIAEEAIADDLGKALERAGAYGCTPEESRRLATFLFHDRGFNIEAIGKNADWIARQAGLKGGQRARILLAPIERIGIEEPLSKEKLCPVLAFFRAPDRARALIAARAVNRFSGAGHSAAVHANDPRLVMAFAAQVQALRVVVNSPCSQGAAGFGTGLAPTFTIGTGFCGGSSVGENLGPQHLVNWSRIAYASDSSEVMGDFTGLEAWHELASVGDGQGDAPITMGALAAGGLGGEVPPARGDDENLREEIRRVIAEELRAFLKG